MSLIDCQLDPLILGMKDHLSKTQMLPNEKTFDEYLWLTMVIYCFIHSLNNIYWVSVTVLCNETLTKESTHRRGMWWASGWELRRALSRALSECSVLAALTTSLSSHHCRAFTDTVLHKVSWLSFIWNSIFKYKNVFGCHNNNILDLTTVYAWHKVWMRLICTF